MAAKSRFEKLFAIMRQSKLDIVALIPGPNLRYLSNSVHFLMERPIVMFVPLDEQPIVVIPKLEIPLFKKHLVVPRIFYWSDAEGYEIAFASAFEALDVHGKTIGVEGLYMRFFEGEIIRSLAPKATVIDASSYLSELRIIKEVVEIASLRKAIQISESALQTTLSDVRVGMSEREIASQLEAHIKAQGGEGFSFDMILHGGSNTALPHSGPLDYRIQHGDPLLVDFGATFGGYCADITRTVFVGEANKEYRQFYAVVQAANEAGRMAAKPGVTAESVDLAARKVIVEAGYKHLMRHRTGHGLGLQAHEAPYIVEGNQRILQPGMVITIEPGIYRMGEIGVRIEDNVLITESGSDSLTTYARDVVVLEQ